MYKNAGHPTNDSNKNGQLGNKNMQLSEQAKSTHNYLSSKA